MSPDRVCYGIGCNEKFTPKTHNHKYHSDKCKRGMETAKNVLNGNGDVPIEEVWQQEETRKEEILKNRLNKDQWLLENKTFAMFDIETTAMDADFGRLICACIKPLGEEPKVFSTLRGDKKLIAQIRNELAKYDYIITWYGTGFDIPFLAARLVKHGLTPIGETRHLDMYYTSRSAMKFASNRQAEVAKSLLGQAERTQVAGAIWGEAAGGSKKATEYIIEHCVADVNDLEDVFKQLVPFRNISSTPLRVY